MREIANQPLYACVQQARQGGKRSGALQTVLRMLYGYPGIAAWGEGRECQSWTATG